MSNQRYMQRGVSASKEDVHNAIKNIDKGVFPKAFCKIIPDILGGDPDYCNIMHADGAGTKSSLAFHPCPSTSCPAHRHSRPRDGHRPRYQQSSHLPG